MKISKPIRYTLSLSVAAALLYLSFRKVDWRSFVSDMKVCSWGFVFAAMCTGVAGFFFRSQRWKCLLRPVDPTIDSLTTFNGVNIGYLANFVFPRIGELVRCGFIHRRSAARHKYDPENIATFDKTFGTVLMSRSWDILCVLVLFVLLLVFRWDKFGDFFTHSLWLPLRQKLPFNIWWLVAAGTLLGGAVMFFVLYRRNEKGRSSRIKAFISGICDGFVSWASMPNKWKFFVWTVLLWISYWLSSWLIILSIPAISSLGAVDALFVCVVGSFAWMVPVPGGFGAYHYIVSLALSTVYALSWESGIMCATLNHESQAIIMLVCGIVSYLIETLRK